MKCTTHQKAECNLLRFYLVRMLSRVKRKWN